MLNVVVAVVRGLGHGAQLNGGHRLLAKAPAAGMPATQQPPGSVLAGSIDAFQQSVGHAVLGSFCAALEN